MGEIGADAMIVGAGPSLRYFTGVGWNATERLVAMILPRARRARPWSARASSWARWKPPSGSRRRSCSGKSTRAPTPWPPRVLADLGAKTLAIDPALPFFAFDGLRLRRAGRRHAQRRARHRRLPDDQVAGRARPDEPGQGHDAGGPPPRRAHPRARDHHHRRPPLHRPGAPRAGRRRRLVLLRGAVRGRLAYPHGLPGEQRLAKGDIVLIDTGCKVQGYNSDITRTYVFGEPSRRTAPRLGGREARPGRRLRRREAGRRLRGDRRRRRAASWRPPASAPTTRCPACRTAPATASASRSTRPPTWCAATRPRSRPACAFPTSR